jgi:predicted ABC-type ATPase
LAVRVWFVGLQGPELHIARVKARVAHGGHDIPEARIRERYERSRQNLIRLLSRLTELRLFDNSQEGDLARGIAPAPRLLLYALDGRIVENCKVSEVPEWAKPIFLAALREYSA